MTGDRSIEQNCIYHREGKCTFHSAFVTDCRLCFNFKSVVNVAGKGKVKALYSFFDYLDSTGLSTVMFPEGDEVQTTL